jgi:hypothetical protein
VTSKSKISYSLYGLSYARQPPGILLCPELPIFAQRDIYKMNKIKQLFGIVWMMLAALLVVFMVYQAYAKVNLAPEGVVRTNTLLQWIIILMIFIPICWGLFIFGRYALKNEFDNLDADD